MEPRIKHTRLRPGEQRRHQLSATLGTYDLAQDRRIRAELVLLGGSLGAACRRHPGAGHQEATGCRSFIARDELHLVSNDQPSNKELELIAQVIDFGADNRELRERLPEGLYQGVLNAAFKVLHDEYQQLRRARDTGTTLEYLKRLQEQPRYKRLVMDRELDAHVL